MKSDSNLEMDHTDKIGTRVAVIGSRSIENCKLSDYIPKDCVLIVSGGARGVDTLAGEYAAEHGIKVLTIRPDYRRYGRGAPLRRNNQIVDTADLVLAFWDEKSKGTKYTIDYAKKTGKPVVVVSCEVKSADGANKI